MSGTYTSRQVRDAIVALMASVPDVGQVHAFERYLPRGQWVETFYKTVIDGQPMVRGWHVRRLGFTRTREGMRKRVVTTWLVRGYQGVADAEQTELVFDDLIDALVAAFDQSKNLGLDGVQTLDGSAEEGLQLQDSTPVSAGGVLCHHARLILRTVHHE